MNDRESGFTLIELLVAILILGIILGPLLGSIIVGLKTTDDTIQRLAESVDAQTAVSLFVTDVQSAVTTTVTDGTCAPEPANVLVSFRWTDHGDSATSTVDDFDRIATYVTDTVVGEEKAKDSGGVRLAQLTNLLRKDCSRRSDQGGAYGASESLNVASFLNSATGPVVVCDSEPAGTCPDPKPTFVAITATEASGYEFRLSAKRRSTG